MENKRTILLEIGVEEIPARFLPTAMRDLKDLLSKSLKDAAIGFDTLGSAATPRRLMVSAEGVIEMQSDRVREAYGPPKSAALAKDGTFTKAAEGFAKSQGVEPTALVVKPKEGKGEYMVAVVHEKGRATIEVLPEILKGVVLSLNFPKSMRWGNGNIRFARPIHWIVSVFGSDVIEFEIEGLKSGRTTRGHRFLSPATIDINSPADYRVLLEKHSVVVDPAQRMKYIEAQAAQLASTVGGRPVYSEELLSHVACILEYPVAVLGGFDKKYLELPDELLQAVMVGHQKYFPIADAKTGRLVNSFIVVSNTKADNAGAVRAGAERVIRARFDDARFYFEDDRAITLAERAKALCNVTFQERLGSLYDKTERVERLAAAIAAHISPENKDAAIRAAELGKADLISGVVREFPELQGIMGMYYARHHGEPEAVATAIREQYMPSGSGSAVPATDAGAIVALADRLDNLCSFFSIDLRPTGSEDPFALRRQALGVISILEERGYSVSLKTLLEHSIPAGGRLEADLVDFFEQRLEALLGARGHGHDVVQSVLRFGTGEPIKNMSARLEAIKSLKAHPAYNEFLVGIKRVRNICPAAEIKLPPVDHALFKTDEERKLDSVLDSVVLDVKMHMGEGKPYEAVLDLMKLTGTINTFFEKVLVMDKDEAVKNNRLSLLRELWSVALTVADFSKLSERNNS